jgi:hypothetical protein
MSGIPCEAVAVSDVDFREPWSRPDAEHGQTFESEAYAEVAPGHELQGLALRAVARCQGCDDVVFHASDDTFAIVHLTWARKPEAPPLPRTARLGGFLAVESAMDQHEH